MSECVSVCVGGGGGGGGGRAMHSKRVKYYSHTTDNL